MRINTPTIRTAALVLAMPVFVAFLFLSATRGQQPGLPDAPKPKNNQTQPKGASESAWPRTFTSGVNTFAVYQPQVDKWDDNLVDLYCAVEQKAGRETAPKYGVV